MGRFLALVAILPWFLPTGLCACDASRVLRSFCAPLCGDGTEPSKADPTETESCSCCQTGHHDACESPQLDDLPDLLTGATWMGATSRDPAGGPCPDAFCPWLVGKSYGPPTTIDLEPTLAPCELTQPLVWPAVAKPVLFSPASGPLAWLPGPPLFLLHCSWVI